MCLYMIFYLDNTDDADIYTLSSSSSFSHLDFSTLPTTSSSCTSPDELDIYLHHHHNNKKQYQHNNDRLKIYLSKLLSYTLPSIFYSSLSLSSSSSSYSSSLNSINNIMNIPLPDYSSSSPLRCKTPIHIQCICIHHIFSQILLAIDDHIYFYNIPINTNSSSSKKSPTDYISSKSSSSSIRYIQSAPLTPASMFTPLSSSSSIPSSSSSSSSIPFAPYVLRHTDMRNITCISTHPSSPQYIDDDDDDDGECVDDVGVCEGYISGSKYSSYPIFSS